MSLPPNKRRKMRPNNVIALERAKQESLLKEAKRKKGKGKEASSKRGTNINAEMAINSTVNSDDTDNEVKNEHTNKVKKRPSSQRRVRSRAKTASDSDSISGSDDADSAEKAAKRTTALQRGEKNKPAQLKTTKGIVSASDSDETDYEHTIKAEATTDVISKFDTTPQTVGDHASNYNVEHKTLRYNPDSSEDETSNDPNPVSNSIKKADVIASTATDNANASLNSRQFRESITKRNHLVGNRLSFRRTGEYDASKPPAVNLSKRLNDSFLPSVQQDFFVSESDSEPDSGEDYDTKEFPTWQQTLSWNRNPEEDPWPKQRKFGYSDKLKLEKRIKKICRRENLSFNEAQEIFSGKRKQHLRFFQKIAAIFPNIPLYLLAKRLKETYHIKRNSTPWSKAEIEMLEGLIEIHGNNAELLSTLMDRSPKNISDFIFNHKSSTKTGNKWSQEEDELLAKSMAQENKNNSGRVSFLNVEPLFKGERSQKQIYARYYYIRHRIQPDGTLVPNRLATPIEELEYLKNLLNQVNDHDLEEESQLDFAKNRGFVKPNFYLNSRTNVKGFEKMCIKDILKELISRQELIVKSRRGEGLL
ncbi:hypothetical protein BD408DRAFT_183135 [Parasitella parasitica]|nr:hypothetical protein BD408DRAFT_183135 [Parasitella parasitica]